MEKKDRAEEALLAFRLEFEGLIPRSPEGRRRHRIASRRMNKFVRSATTLGQWMALDTQVSDRLVTEHGWKRIGARVVPPEQAVGAQACLRQSMVNPRLLAALRDFRNMSPDYRAAVGCGTLRGVRPLPT